MNEAVDISVVIVNYNVKDFLYQCLQSIQDASKELSVETIVVDNNSSDGSIEFLKPNFEDVNFIQLNENFGFAKANNIGFEAAKGKYILILNPDTILQEDTLTKMYNFMENNKDIGCSGCKVLNPDGSFQLACRRGLPTPWSSFAKLFGLQKLFPKSKLFAQYNQTFRSIDESYEIDAVIGAFMFCRKESIDSVEGFDTEFFMYGEDLDLCHRIRKSGWKIYYFHETSIIHYKGESTKRSSINEIKHFYNAMEIFTKKHYSKSFMFLMLLRFGIYLRTFIAYLNKYKKDIFVIITDVTAINLALMLGTWYRFGGPFSFPDYAYPIVFIAITLVMFVSMIAVGEYFESKPTSRKALFGLLISFFILSSFTYYFKDFAFSRGVLLMTIGLTSISTLITRSTISLLSKTKGTESDRRIAFIGLNDESKSIVNSLKNSELRNIDIVGFITINPAYKSEFLSYPILGNIEYLWKILEKYDIHEVIISEKNLAKNDLMKLIASNPGMNVRFHIADRFEELLSSRIINEITGIEPTIPDYNISKLRFRLFKRFTDILISLFLLSIGLPFLYLFERKITDSIKMIFKVLMGKYSLVGIYPTEESEERPGKEGITGLAHISKPELLTDKAVNRLNEYYRLNYSFSLDIDIILKFLFRKNSGKFSS